MNKTLYIVTYWDYDVEYTGPTVTVFDNLEAATKCKDYFSKIYMYVTLDKSELYSNFIQTEELQAKAAIAMKLYQGIDKDEEGDKNDKS